jgi:D-alanyl-lipoteichoic acid acyltransferase DltB (MBOAT superfamily)
MGFVITIILNLVFLGFFKYSNFLFDTTSDIALVLGWKELSFDFEILAPIGISFYTFRVISHLVDTYRGKVAVPHFFSYATYIVYFPQILSGPIMRASDFYTSINNKVKASYNEGMLYVLVLSGLIKKLVIASFLWDFTQAVFVTPQNFSSLDLLIGAVAYSCLIYTDFSGYSDLSNSISMVLGIKTVENFNSPYKATSLKDFWNRWHISLSSWLKDYIYIPLGGGRVAKWRKYFNVLLTMFVSGIWHGAGLTYIVWGLLHGVGSVINNIANDIFEALNKKHFFANFFKWTWGIGQLLGWLITFAFVSFSWIFFNSRTLDSALIYVGGIFNSNVNVNTLLNWRLFILVAVVLVFNLIGKKFVDFCEEFFLRLRLGFKLLVFVIVLYCILRLGPDIIPPFIYFNF